MKDQAKLLRILLVALLAIVFAGSGMATAASAAGAQASAAGLYLAAACAAALCGLLAHGGGPALIAAAALAVAAGAYVPAHMAGFRAIPALAGSWSGGEIDPALSAPAAAALTTSLSFLLGALFFALLYRRETVSLAILILFSTLVASHAASLTASIPAALPGLAAGAAAFALTAGPTRDGAAARALLPGILAVCLALILLPAGRVTWRPLENAANRVRDVFEQYFGFTRQRIAFSINEQGYDHAGEVGGEVVAMLGGPADPHQDAVMRVTTSDELLLRGTVRSTYTGYSWVDTAPRSRYLYYDLTRARVRDAVFGADLPVADGAFREARAQVEILKEGTSTLFAPVRLTKFELPLSTALYYNTAGELFLTREVQPGDAYALTARLPVHGNALRNAAARGEAQDDPQWQQLMAVYGALPEGIDPQVYALTMEITKDAGTAYDRALAIMTYLTRNTRYTLDVEYPPLGRDFVSHFLLDTQAGYCSYYASAMAVLGRIAGLPTRYVEGYLARPGADGTAVLTGEDAHAWAEIYFRGLGWVPFDATGGATGRSGQGSGDRDGGQGEDAFDDDAPEGLTPSPSPTEQDAPGSDLLNEGQTPSPTPTIPPQDEDQDENQNEDQDEPEDSEPPEDPGDGELPPELPPEDEPEPPVPPEQESNDPPSPLPWALLGLLLLVLLAALGVLWVRRRLRQTDPIALCAEAKDPDQAAMILYRACLTALAFTGQAPANGESPEAFAARVANQQKCPEYAAFAEAVARRRYGRQPLKKADLAAGRKAYRGIERALRRGERLRYAVHRMFRGLGDFDRIP